ncbi:hypothetical protein K7W42_21700 [Deinococcus sp. HMF7604]|uniref:hypothetical protein n=1 Tax=Deinococcus betulae TaxID=2873312 RepID=UPI001CC90A47|nr:hypothetical protein [Deinococcus betulae]MBZ9753452.1 hypothetical protein [Deinococcus betulae]
MKRWLALLRLCSAAAQAQMSAAKRDAYRVAAENTLRLCRQGLEARRLEHGVSANWQGQSCAQVLPDEAAAFSLLRQSRIELRPGTDPGYQVRVTVGGQSVQSGVTPLPPEPSDWPRWLVGLGVAALTGWLFTRPGWARLALLGLLVLLAETGAFALLMLALYAGNLPDMAFPVDELRMVLMVVPIGTLALVLMRRRLGEVWWTLAGVGALGAHFFLLFAAWAWSFLP